MIKKFTLAIVFVLLQLLAYPQQQENFNSKKVEKAIQKYLDSIYNPATDFGGATIGIVLPNGEALEFGIGFNDVHKKLKMKSGDRMLGGSTGKIFVSAAIMQLIESGLLGLDDLLSTHLGSHEWYRRLQNHEQITLRNLLQHSSGISRYVFAPDFQTDLKRDPDRIWLPQELISYVLDHEPLFPAGSDFAYSDTNYILLGMVLEQVTKNTLYDYVDSNIIKTLGLTRTTPQIDRTIPGLAIGYSSPNDPFYPGIVVANGVYKNNVQFEWAGGGFVTNSKDLAMAGKMIYENTLFSNHLMDDFLNGIPAKGLGGTWGLGVHIKKTPVGISYGHSGFFPGYITQMLYFPEHGFSIAFQVNTSDPKQMGLFRKIHALVSEIFSILELKLDR